MHKSSPISAYDVDFDDHVLTIDIATGASGEENADHMVTTTIVENITQKEWKEWVSDFLFLKKPAKVCDTDTGTLLLDEEYMHKLYVKGFFINCIKMVERKRGKLVEFSSLSLYHFDLMYYSPRYERRWTVVGSKFFILFHILAR